MSGVGLLGYLGASLPPDRVDSACQRAPWRGQPACRTKTRFAEIIATGTALHAVDNEISVVIHGRIDNIDALAQSLDVCPDNAGNVVIAAWRRFGEDVARELLGDFALLLLDSRRATLFAARDWIGARPLFWGEADGVIAFGSEVKQVLALLDLPYQLDERTAAIYKRLGEPPVTATFAEGIQAVPPSGQVMVRVGAPPRLTTRPVVFEPLDISMSEAARLIRRRLEIAVERRTKGSGRPAALISGGMDSTSVAAVAASLAERGAAAPLIAGLTLHFPAVPEVDETTYAHDLAARWNIPLFPIVIAPGDLAGEPSALLALHDGPVFPGIQFFDGMFAEAQRQSADTILTGQGADLWQSQMEQEIMFSVMRRDWRAALAWMSYSLQRYPRTTLKEIAATARATLLREREGDHFAARVHSYWTRTAFEVEERLGQYFGLQMEAPFADRELAEVFVGLSPGLRSTTRGEKYPLRHAMTYLLPGSILSRMDKSFFDPVFRAGFGPPGRSQTIGQKVAEYYLASWREHVS